jgi:uncharacterized membrane protein
LPSLAALHRIFVHFPIAFICLAWALEAADFLNRSRLELRRSYRRLYYASYLTLVLTYFTGHLSSMRTGIRMRDPAWVADNMDLFASLVNHRGAATLTLLTLSAIAAIKWFGLSDARIAAPRHKLLELALTTLALLMTAFTAHLGGNLNL